MSNEQYYKINKRPKDDIGDDEKIVTIDDLDNKTKEELFSGTRELLLGRIINIKTGQIKSPKKKLFQLRKEKFDEKSDLSEIVRPVNGKKLEIYESYDELHKSLTKSSYYDAEVRNL